MTPSLLKRLLEIQRNEATEHLVKALGGRHGSLDDKATNVLPALLEEGDEVVDGEHQVGDELLLGHADVANGNTKAKNLLQLELDGGLDVGDLGGHVLSVGDGGGELAGCRSLILASVLQALAEGDLSSWKTYPWTDRDQGDGGSA